MDKIHEIAQIIFPQTDFINNSELFVKKTHETISVGSKTQDVTVYKFNTWMNLFAAKKYYKYCNLGNLFLNLEIQGSYRVCVIGSNKSAAYERIDEKLLEVECIDNASIQIPDADRYDAIYFELITDIHNPITISKIFWGTDIAPQRDNKLAVVTCTFKREDYVTKNIKKFEQFKNENPHLQDKIYMFISDNGRTLPESFNSENVTIYPNINAGGAGGFARGLMEVMKLNQGFTRVLFMDDDVEIFPESFYRTLLLSNYLKEEYKDSFINGAMLDLYNKSMFFENLAIQNKLWVRAYHTEQKLNYNNILHINEIPDEIFNNPDEKVDTAWWYHCFDITVAKEKGLPVPVFFRGDDVEWSWRNFGKHHISMNGICIWHSPFAYRVSKAAEYYYLPRNMFMINSLYTDKFKKKYKKLFKKLFSYALKTYDYVSLDIFFKAMNDILKGSDAYRENPEAQFVEVNKISQKVNYEECHSFEELYRVKNIRKRNKRWRNTVANLTNWGLLCPEFLFKKLSEVLDWYPTNKDFALVKTVKVYNLLTKKCEIRKFDREKIIHCKKVFNKLLNEIDKNYDKLHEDFIKAHKEFTTFEFWEKYLKQ